MKVMELLSWTKFQSVSQEIQFEVPNHLWGQPRKQVLNLHLSLK